MSASPSVAGLVCGLIATVYSSAAYAQSLSALESEGRRALMEEAQAARARGDHAAALTAAQRALAIQSSPSLRLFIAEEEYAGAHVAAAFVSARLCRVEAERDATLRNREVLATRCASLAAELERRVGRVRVLAVSPQPDELAVRVGETALTLTLLGAPFPVDPGAVQISATARGGLRFARTITVAAGQITEVTLELAAPDRDEPQPSPGAVRAVVVTRPHHATAASRPSVAPWALVGVGGALVVTGAVFFGLTAERIGFCAHGCDVDAGAAGTSEADRAQSQVDAYWPVGWSATAVGLGAVATGLAWALLRAPAVGAERAPAQVRAGPGGASVRFAF